MFWNNDKRWSHAVFRAYSTVVSSDYHHHSVVFWDLELPHNYCIKLQQFIIPTSYSCVSPCQGWVSLYSLSRQLLQKLSHRPLEKSPLRTFWPSHCAISTYPKLERRKTVLPTTTTTALSRSGDPPWILKRAGLEN